MCEYKVALALDCWTSPNHRACMSITVSWVRRMKDDTEELTTMLLDFFELPCSHSGFNMATAVEKTLREYGIEDKVCLVHYRRGG
ncbi:hypothetical protein F5880DRAFT_1493684 [Lentinula raphanica]|nr:hypothetical protein F5880DRAFT_1493684 [Lentinula raphanica]